MSGACSRCVPLKWQSWRGRDACCCVGRAIPGSKEHHLHGWNHSIHSLILVLAADYCLSGVSALLLLLLCHSCDYGNSAFHSRRARKAGDSQAVKAVAVFKWEMIKRTQQCSLILQSTSQTPFDLHTLGSTRVGGSALAGFSSRAVLCQRMRTSRLEHGVRLAPPCRRAAFMGGTPASSSHGWPAHRRGPAAAATLPCNPSPLDLQKATMNPIQRHFCGIRSWLNSIHVGFSLCPQLVSPKRRRPYAQSRLLLML